MSGFSRIGQGSKRMPGEHKYHTRRALCCVVDTPRTTFRQGMGTADRFFYDKKLAGSARGAPQNLVLLPALPRSWSA
eukprot:2593502-Pleurochrysis_carterae.AAC.3